MTFFLPQHKPDGMPDLGQLAPPVMRRRASFHADEVRLKSRDKGDHLFAAKLSGNNHFVAFVDAMNLKTFLESSIPMV